MPPHDVLWRPLTVLLVCFSDSTVTVVSSTSTTTATTSGGETSDTTLAGKKLRSNVVVVHPRITAPQISQEDGDVVQVPLAKLKRISTEDFGNGKIHRGSFRMKSTSYVMENFKGVHGSIKPPVWSRFVAKFVSIQFAVLAV